MLSVKRNQHTRGSVERISTNGPVAYGTEEIDKALHEGAIETLLISADLLRDEEASIGGKVGKTGQNHLQIMAAN